MSAAPALTLVSHHLCPYVQRAAIVLQEKGVAFARRYVDLADKPEWFRAVSPLGKTPVLLVEGDALFESAVICEYLDDVLAPRLHPQDALDRARHRAWMEFGSSLLNTIGAFYNAPDEPALLAKREELRARFAQLEAVLPEAGPFFNGERFCIVDAVFGPVFRYFDVFEQLGEPPLFEGLPKVRAWRAALAARPSVREAVGRDYADRLTRFLVERGSALSRRIAGRLG
ncbi:glutathione S-transferase family protein [Caenimonas aquaedulcis]|uniref:glutathione transferase n=1 Tax=Caenimonas aquaedulcis TaxID=2793270 RepID=A0A931H5Y8_9BURK|nr:glutathione S-transferase family protein [Caenimonas aquaedulcis]MBG9389249.1 glutathione S-transferase family protein [Caenimonas aquaedulcis]